MGLGGLGDLMDYDFNDYSQRAAYYGGAGIEGGPADGASPEGDPDMASRRERRRRRAERRERVADVWQDLGFEVEAGPFRVQKEAGQRGRGRGRGRAPSAVSVTPTIPPAVWIGAAALGVVLLTQRGGGR
jgi:hypothetical protein